MQNMMMLSGAIALAIASPAWSQGNSDKGGKGAQSQSNPKGQGNADKGQKPPKADKERSVSQERGGRTERQDTGSRVNARERDARERGNAQSARDNRRANGRDTRGFEAVDNQNRLAVSARGLIDGCPPGLAKKNNGCLPPGQAKKIYNRDDRFASLFNGVPMRYQGFDNSYNYNDGYLYRTQGNSIVSWLPLLGGALGVGEIFPQNFGSRELPYNFGSYYGQNDSFDYRYADRAIFAINPETQAIQSVVALLTGDDWAVGQPAPAGYGAYNVPLDYRDRYNDTSQANYRYSDGEIYRIDPTTQLVTAVISLLT